MTAVRRYRVPPAVAAVAVTAIYGTVNLGVPIALSSFGSKHGWEGARPGLANLVGVAPLLVGLLVVIRAASDHAKAMRRIDWRFMKVDPEHLLTPDYLVTDGLYRLSRNPLYVGDIAMWIGWAVLLGSVPVAGGLAALDDWPQCRRSHGGAWTGAPVRCRVARVRGRTPRFLGRRSWTPLVDAARGRNSQARSADLGVGCPQPSTGEEGLR